MTFDVLKDQQAHGVDTLVELPYDLYAALRENNVSLTSSITKILAEITGANDGPNWHWLVELAGERYAYITGGCDYTGWDCQSNCESFEAATLDECLRLVPEAERGDFQQQLCAIKPTLLALEDLVGLRHLDARAQFKGPTDRYGDAPTIAVLRLDGILYWFQEDPDDSYRSSLDHVRIAYGFELPDDALAEFPARLVNCAINKGDPEDAHARNHTLIGTDEATGTVLFEIGTEHYDDYYPSFVCSWTPPEGA